MKPVVEEISLSQIVFDEAIYPRKAHDPQLVQRYAESLDAIETKQRYLSISADNKLLDGKHRWLAYRKVLDGGDRTIKVFRYDARTPHEQFRLAVRLNSDHGAQLSDEDKQQDAIRLYNFGYTYDSIAEELSVGKRKVSDWLSRTVKEEKDRRKRKIFEMWLACHTQQEIADALGVAQKNVSTTIDNFILSVLENQKYKAAAEHTTDFNPPLYNIWKQQEKTPGSKHFGNSEVRWLDNLLYLYTQPLDVVIDPFAGGGSTIDLCKKRKRRYFASDRKPIVEREHEIRQHDLTDGLPKVPRWKDVKLVYLDPPYWKQAEGQYSNDPTDLANMPLDQFHESLDEIINSFAKKLTDAYIALIIQPTQWKAPETASGDNGFPWQSSIGAISQRMVFVDRGESVEVNGRKFSGPLYVARQSSLREVSFVALGADDQRLKFLPAIRLTICVTNGPPNANVSPQFRKSAMATFLKLKRKQSAKVGM